MQEHSIGPGGSWHRGVPAVADYKFAGKGVQDGQLVRAVALHNLARVALYVCSCTHGRIARDEATVVDGRISTARRIGSRWAAELFQHLQEFMARVDRHYPIRTLLD